MGPRSAGRYSRGNGLVEGAFQAVALARVGRVSCPTCLVDPCRNDTQRRGGDAIHPHETNAGRTRSAGREDPSSSAAAACPGLGQTECSCHALGRAHCLGLTAVLFDREELGEPPAAAAGAKLIAVDNAVAAYCSDVHGFLSEHRFPVTDERVFTPGSLLRWHCCAAKEGIGIAAAKDHSFRTCATGAGLGSPEDNTTREPPPSSVGGGELLRLPYLLSCPDLLRIQV